MSKQVLTILAFSLFVFQAAARFFGLSPSKQPIKIYYNHTIDPTGSRLDKFSSGQQISSISHDSRVFYILGNDIERNTTVVKCLNTTDGRLLATIDTPLALPAHPAIGQFVLAGDRDLVYVWGNNATGHYLLLRGSRFNQEWTEIGSIEPGYGARITTPHAYCKKEQKIYLQTATNTGIYNIAFDLVSGEFSFLPESSGLHIQTFAYDADEDSIVGIGMVAHAEGYSRGILRMDCATGELSNLGPIDSRFDASHGGVATFDRDSRILTWLGMQSQGSTAVHFVHTHVDDPANSTSSDYAICYLGNGDCPIAMETVY